MQHATKSTQKTRRDNGRPRRYSKKSFKASVRTDAQHHELVPTRHRQNELEANSSDSSLPANTSLLSSITSTLIIPYINKIDPTKLILGVLLTITMVLMQYGTRQSSLQLSFTTTTALKLNNSHNDGIHFSEIALLDDNKGHQAQSQVSIPTEYSHFVELSEFANAVEASRIQHRKQQTEQYKTQLHGNAKVRRLQQIVPNDPEITSNAVPDDDEEAEMQHAMDAAWDQTIQQADSSHIQQMQESSLLPLHNTKHVPFFWHIPRAGGTTLSTYFGTCLGLVQASSSYSSPPVYTRWEDQEFANRFKDPTLYVVHMKMQQFVNVDLNDFQGVMRAVKGKLISSDLADLVVVQDVSMGSFLLEEARDSDSTSPNHPSDKSKVKGVLFSIFRHPVERAISSFYSKQQVHDVHFDPSLEIYSLTDWANSPQYINDYMVRSLVGKLNEQSPQNQPPLNRNDLDVAKEILRRKCLIGLTDEKSESLKRFEKFFDWNADEAHRHESVNSEDKSAERTRAEKWRKSIIKDEECKDRLLHYSWEKKHKHDIPEENDVSYKLLESKNRYDIELYIYARQLFDEQYYQLGFHDDTT